MKNKNALQLGGLMKKIVIVAITIISWLIIGCSSLSEFAKVMSEPNKDIERRYGSGSMNDLLNTKDPQKTSTLAPYISRINIMFDKKQITVKERDKRKNELSDAYDRMKSGRLTSIDFNDLCRKLSQ